jgi:hypothetical protein
VGLGRGWVGLGGFRLLTKKLLLPGVNCIQIRSAQINQKPVLIWNPSLFVLLLLTCHPHFISAFVHLVGQLKR